MYVPHAKYPKNKKNFNLIERTPDLFKNIDFCDFATILKKRFSDFTDSQSFLYASQFQENSGSKLVMLFSAIERLFGTWKSLNVVLSNKKFTKKLKQCRNGVEAHDFLKDEINKYLDEYGSLRKIIAFYTDNLDKNEKIEIINGILYLQNYQKKKYKDGSIMLTPTRTDELEMSVSKNQKELDTKLAKRIKNIAYHIRSEYVHNAEYFPFPDRKTLDKRKYFQFTKKKSGLPHQDWLISISFERFYEITENAFVKFWSDEYNKLGKSEE